MMVEADMGIPRLSICMPTYNFGRFIGATLESIIKQAPPDIEIVVLDGASSDNTGQVVRSFQRRFQNLFYYRLDRRGGIDRDLAKSVELATGEYCWLFSSDDLMNESALDRVLKEIALGFDIYVCGLNLCTLDMKPIRRHRILNIDSDAEFDLRNECDHIRYFSLAQTTTAFFSFMSSLIVKKSRWDAIPLDEAFVGSLWAHVARIFRMIPQGLRVKYISASLLDKRGDNDSFMEKGLVYRYLLAVDGYHRLADTFFGRTSREASHIRRVIRNEFPPFRALLNLKLGLKKSGNLQDLMLLDQLAAKVYAAATFSERLGLLVYKHMPLGVYKVLRAAYRALKPYIRRRA